MTARTGSVSKTTCSQRSLQWSFEMLHQPAPNIYTVQIQSPAPCIIINRMIHRWHWRPIQGGWDFKRQKKEPWRKTWARLFLKKSPALLFSAGTGSFFKCWLWLARCCSWSGRHKKGNLSPNTTFQVTVKIKHGGPGGVVCLQVRAF